MITHRAPCIVLAVCSTLCSTTLLAEPEANPEVKAEANNDYSAIVARHVQPAIDAELIPGAVVGIYKDGKASYYPVGTLDFGVEQAPSTDTLYEIGSISKVITGVLFADAVRREEVTHDTLVNDLLPEGFQTKPKDGEDIRLWHLTTHTSGWSTAPINLRPIDGDRPFKGYTRQMLFSAARIMEPKTKPGTAFEYSNFAVGMLGTLLADNANAQYEQLTKDRVLTPLGIKDFTITLDDEQQQRLAPATNAGRAATPWETMGPMDPAGMWISSTPRLMDFALANISDGGDTISESLAMSREKLFDVAGFGSVCSGWMLAMDGSTYWHNGMTGGYSSYIGINREHDMAVVMLTNGATIQTTVIGEKLMQSVFGLDPDPIEPVTAQRLDQAYCDRLVGVYASEMGFEMTITSERGRVFARVTGQQSLDLAPVADKEHRFRYTLVDAELQFDLPEAGSADAVTLYQNGMEIRCERKE
jgi:CubicO group peptidase (beta-lactamase class C family)